MDVDQDSRKLPTTEQQVLVTSLKFRYTQRARKLRYPAEPPDNSPASMRRLNRGEELTS